MNHAVLRRLAWVLLASTCVSDAARAPIIATMHYKADVGDAKWEADGTKEQCTMTHTIPSYGSAVFQQTAGESAPLFSLTNWIGTKQATPAIVSVVTQPWQHARAPLFNFKVTLRPGGDPVWLNQAASTILLTQLQNGFGLRIRYKLAQVKMPILVDVAAVKFNDALNKFTQCVSALRTYKLGEIKETILAYPVGSSELNTRQKAHLAKITRYIQENPKAVKRILIRSYIDPIGKVSTNRIVAQTRSEVLKQYFADAKIDAGLLDARTGGGVFRFKSQVAKLEGKGAHDYGVVVIQLKQD